MSCLQFLLYFSLFRASLSSHHLSKLYDDLFLYYNRHVRPVQNSSSKVVVNFGASLIRIIQVDEVNQVLTTNLWLQMQWNDHKLKWSPQNYGDIRIMHVPGNTIWTPDIVLYNNAHGRPDIRIFADALVTFEGRVVWRPPAIYNSFCEIDIEFFPYDQQSCRMKFGGWTYDGIFLDMRQITVRKDDKIQELHDAWNNSFQYLEYGMDLSYFYESSEWDLMNLTSERHEQKYPGCCGMDSYIDISFEITLRRKPLFYTVNMVIPCMLIGILSTFVFWIPAVELKMTFSISILIALTVFYLVLIEIIPPTSLVVPLIGKFLLSTMMLVGVSIFVSVFTLNLFYRNGATHSMPKWIRWLFLEKLSKTLFIKPHAFDKDSSEEEEEEEDPPKLKRKMGVVSNMAVYGANQRRLSELAISRGMDPDVIRRMLANIHFILQYFRAERDQNKISQDWSHVARVMDRLLLVAFTIFNIISTTWIVFQAPHLFDWRNPLPHTQPIEPLGSGALSK